MAPADPATPLLDAALAAFLVGPVAINVASRSPALVPSVARGYGCRVGSEVRLGNGILGIAALERTPIRIGFCSGRRGRERSPSSDCAPLALLDVGVYGKQTFLMCRVSHTKRATKALARMPAVLRERF